MDNAIKNENRLTKMEERLKTIEEKVDNLPNLIMEKFLLQAEIIKTETLQQARDDDDKRYAKIDAEKLMDEDYFDKRVNDVISKQIGRWFITKVVVSTAVIVAIIQYVISVAE